jgi:hypothetical protein
VLGVDNWALLVVKLSGRALDVRVQLLLFVLWKDYRVGRRGLKFEPYRYGPWSRELQDVLDRLASEGYLSAEVVEVGEAPARPARCTPAWSACSQAPGAPTRCGCIRLQRRGWRG